MRHQRQELKPSMIGPGHARVTMGERRLQERIRSLALNSTDDIWVLDFRNMSIYRLRELKRDS